MGNSLTLYPNIDKEWRKKLNSRFSELNAAYSGRGRSYELTCREDGSGLNRCINIVDDSGEWSPDSHNIEIYGKVRIENIRSIFGKSGIAESDAVLGVALLWKSRLSGMRGSMQIGTITADDTTADIEFRKAFRAATLRGNVEVSVQLYVVDAGTDSMELIPGIMLGELDSVVFILEGIGSTFAVFEKTAPGEPLWEVECEWDDPETDQFSECVKVTINNAHPAWTACSEEEPRRELIKEIMASSMQVVISELIAGSASISADCEPGSVCDAINYLAARAGLSMESGASVAKSVRAYLDKSMK